MKPKPAITEADLHAFLDGQLADDRSLQVEEYLADKPAEIERLRAYERNDRALRERFASLLAEPVPGRLRAVVERRRPLPWLRYAAAVAWTALAGFVGWTLHDQLVPTGASGQGLLALLSPSSAALASLPRQAAIAHAVFTPDVRRPVEIGADQEQALVTWLTKRLGAPVKAPKLSRLGYDLIGGRLLPGADGPVAQFMYQDGGGQRLTLYVTVERQPGADTAFRFAQEGSVNVFYWIDGHFGYALSGSLDRNGLARVSQAVYEQLDAAVGAMPK